MAPSISPLNNKQPNYSIVDSRAFIADLSMDVNAFGTRAFTVTRPDPAPGLAIVLRHVSPPVEVALHNLTGTNTSVPGWSITVSTTPPSGGSAQLTCNIQDISGNGAIDELWQLRVEATNPATWALAVDNKAVNEVTRLVCDPVAAFSTPPPATVFENQSVALVAANAAVNTVVGPAPTVTYQWEHTASIAIMDLPSCGPSQTHTVNTPGVYADIGVPIRLTVGFDTTCTDIGTAFLRRSTTAAPMTIRPRPQQMALVLDRSGSMSLEGRWDNAQTAARMITNLFAELREGVHPDDRVGIVVFEDEACAWHGLPVSTRIAPVMAPAKLSDAESSVCGLALGAPGTCTPIGDGLIAGMDMLVTGGPDDPNPTDPDPDARFTMILLTDGFENSGTVQVGPGPLQPGASTTFEQERIGTPQRSSVNQRMRLFTVGLGATVDEQVLNHLAAQDRYLLITDPTQLAKAFGDMLTVSQEVNQLQTHLTPPSGNADPSPPPTGNAVYFTTTTGADKLALGVLATSGTVELARRQGTNFVPEGVVRSCTDHIVASVGNVGALGSGAMEWRVVHQIGGTAQSLPVNNVLAYEDLHVKADVLLDKPEYLTGDTMLLTVRLRHDAAPILKATVRAELDAPAEGRGEALTAVGLQFSFERHGEDPTTQTGAMIEEVLRVNGWKRWPRRRPTGPFEDGTDELHDLDGDGNYTNTFAKVFKEGTYTWEIFVEGVDTQGNRFDRRLALSTHAAVSVSRRATRVEARAIKNHPSGMLAAEVSIIPQDSRGERLGPGHDDVVIWSLRDGLFEHVVDKQPAPVYTDGSYRRVILYDRKQKPQLRVSASGTVLRKIDVRSLLKHGRDGNDGRKDDR